MPAASVSSFFDAVEDFFANLAGVGWGSLVLGLALFGTYLALRSRAYFHVLRAAYPAEPFLWRNIWGAYMAAYGFNNVVPARGGDIIKLFLTRTSVPRSSYPAIGSSFFVESIFDLCIAIPVLAFAFSQGAFPKPPDFPDIGAADLSFFAAHPRFTLFLLTVLGIAVFVLFAVLSARVKAFWARVRQGLTILRDRERYVREVFLVQLAGWGFRFAAMWMFLDAFGVGGSVENVLLVLGVNAPAAVPAKTLTSSACCTPAPPTRSASRSPSRRSASPSASARSSGSSGSARSGRSSPPDGRRGRPRRPPSSAGPGAPRAPGSRPPGTRWPSRSGPAGPAARPCPGG